MDDRRRAHHLRVPVFPQERQAIEEKARNSGLSVAAYLREVGMGYQVSSITDYKHVHELVRVNGDLGRMGGLLKLWLTDDVKASMLGEESIRALLARIDTTREEMSQVMRGIVQRAPVAENFSR